MRTLYYQPAAGIAGDMHLAALVDLGVPLDHIERELSRLQLSGEYRIEATPAEKMGISGTKVIVHAKDAHDHRHYSTIRDVIDAAGLSRGATRRAQKIFRCIAEAEARIHDIDMDRVHFHEVGAIDSIVDIVGSAIALDYLATELSVTRIISNSVQVGGGTVECAHGTYPVPAPATQEILQGVPCLYGGVDNETTTPTGAAILKASVDLFQPTQPFTPERFGYGIGHKDFKVPNVLRAVLGDLAVESSTGTHLLLEANIDDMPAEAFSPLLDRLLAAGADDAWCAPIIMKKSRPATQLCVLCSSQLRDVLTDMMLNESTTIGLRMIPLDKRMLPRRQQTFTTSLGRVSAKIASLPDGRQRVKVEHDDVLRISQALGLDYLSVREVLHREVNAQSVSQPPSTGR